MQQKEQVAIEMLVFCINTYVECAKVGHLRARSSEWIEHWPSI